MIRWKVVRVNPETKEMESSFSPPGFKKIYRIGETTKADPETLGIMVFERKKDAKMFRNFYYWNKNFKILKVEAKGRGKKPKIVATGTTTDEFKFIAFYEKRSNSARVRFAPKGTICYPEIKVLSVDKEVLRK